MIIDPPSITDYEEGIETITPEGTQNLEPPGAPFLPNDMDKNLLVNILEHNATTPTPAGPSKAHIQVQTS